MNNLDTLFSPSCWTKRPLTSDEIIENHVKIIEEASHQSKKTIPNESDLPYGLLNREKIDIFGIDLSDDAPILVFIHGGYWQEKCLTRKSYHYISQHLHTNGIKTIFIGYELCPDVTLPEIIKGIEKAARKCIEYAVSKKSRGLMFAGHSSGAHLVATLFTDFIRTLSDRDQEVVKAAIFLSGVFDLVPLIKTYVNEPLKLDEPTAVRLSPSKLQIFNGKSTSFYTIVGGDESPEFIRQSKNFSEKLESLDFKSECLIVKNLDHFNIMELFAEDNFELTKFIVDKFKSLP